MLAAKCKCGERLLGQCYDGCVYNIEKQMEGNKTEECVWYDKNKGLWQQMQEPAVYKVDLTTPMALEEIGKELEKFVQRDKERRERLDKEYTDISKVTDADIENIIREYGENPSPSIRVKLKIGGMYGEYPAIILISLKEAAKREYNATQKKSNEEESNQKKNNSKSKSKNS